MKNTLLVRLGRAFMRFSPLSICVVDDRRDYFNEDMISVARSSGYSNIERLYRIDRQTLDRLLQNPPDILILDIKGIVDKTVAKDGFDIASLFSAHTQSYVVLTSAHQFKLRNEQLDADYVIDQRILTPVDFVHELDEISKQALSKKIAPFRRILFRFGFFLLKRAA